MLDLRELATTARRNGWATGSGTVADVRSAAAQLGWKEVVIRRGEGPVTKLRPVSQERARPRSLSAARGLGQQPLHTDGAHLTDPPDLVMLVCEQPNSTPTNLWQPLRPGSAPPPTTALQHGMFLVSGGSESFFAPALSRGRLRYDPGCMWPCDARAVAVLHYFEEALKHSVRHEWTEAKQILVVDNLNTVHARAQVNEGADRELVRISYHVKGRG